MQDNDDRITNAIANLGAERTPAPGWQASVLARIYDPKTRPRLVYYLGISAACALVLSLCLLPYRELRPPVPLEIEIVSPIAVRHGYQRSTGARVGDHLRITSTDNLEIRLYQDDVLVFRCQAGRSSEFCTHTAGHVIAEAELTMAGSYMLVGIRAPTTDPAGSFDRDLAAVVTAGGAYRLSELSVR